MNISEHREVVTALALNLVCLLLPFLCFPFYQFMRYDLDPAMDEPLFRTGPPIWSILIFTLSIIGTAVFCIFKLNRSNQPNQKFLFKLNLIACVLITWISLAIWVPKFLTFATPTLIAKNKIKMELMAQALEKYYEQHQQFPAWSLQEFSITPDSKPTQTPSFDLEFRTQPILTTPIPFRKTHLKDLLTLRKYSFGYLCDREQWILLSPGPDCQFELELDQIQSILAGNTELQLKYSYDPTNGSTSAGGIFLTRKEFLKI